ncbi:hypothetical protein HHK36_016622 [Tetracentron sinense]|uniref:Uncharacterized protein n=1 Tax=Tetracentron sinense TaxID=13715 RepID=A0A834YZV0_TETSI|nr:hypothetical protein HHK36_016622 [Tetracentron sinense]
MTDLMPPQMLAILIQPVGRRYIKRDREGSHRQIWRYYFFENCTYPIDYFHRRYRMRRELFLLILKDVEAYDEYFVQMKDCCNHLGCSSIQKMTVAVCILAYRLSANHYDEYLRISESTAIESLRCFCEAVIVLQSHTQQRLKRGCLLKNKRLLGRILNKHLASCKSDKRSTDVERWRPPPNETISHLEYARNPAILVARISSRLSKIRNRGTNTLLRFDLMKHLWNQFGEQAV